MTSDDVIKTVFATVLGAIVLALTWLVRLVGGNRESAAVATVQRKVLAKRVTDLEDDGLSKEDVREVVGEVMAEHATHEAAANELLTLKVLEEVRKTGITTRMQLQDDVARIVANELKRTNKFKYESRSGDESGSGEK